MLVRLVLGLEGAGITSSDLNLAVEVLDVRSRVSGLTTENSSLPVEILGTRDLGLASRASSTRVGNPSIEVRVTLAWTSKSLSGLYLASFMFDKISEICHTIFFL